MSELFGQDIQSNAHSFTVSQISRKLQQVIEKEFGYVSIRGEVSNYRGPHSSGHVYFVLKDDKACLDAVIWKHAFSKLRHLPQEGLEVVVKGKLTTYAGSSRYQINIESLEPAGQGALMALLEQRKKEFEKEGLFSKARKRALPKLPRTIGVITSPTGAVICDIRHRLRDRFPSHILLWPVRVQGESCAQEVVEAIQGFNSESWPQDKPRPDLLIVARGGGSLEDLWGFNEEIVVRAVSQSKIPIISAIGHETDWTLIDYAADVRAPTPTAAAEFAVPHRDDLYRQLGTVERKLEGSFERLLRYLWQRHDDLERAMRSPKKVLELKTYQLQDKMHKLFLAMQEVLKYKNGLMYNLEGRISPQFLKEVFALKSYDLQEKMHKLSSTMQDILKLKNNLTYNLEGRISPRFLDYSFRNKFEKLNMLKEKIDKNLLHCLSKKHEGIKNTERFLESLSYQRILDRGFVILKDKEGMLIESRKQINFDEDFFINFADGEQRARAIKQSGSD